MQNHGHDHPVRLETNIADPHPGKARQTRKAQTRAVTEFQFGLLTSRTYGLNPCASLNHPATSEKYPSDQGHQARSTHLLTYNYPRSPRCA